MTTTPLAAPPTTVGAAAERRPPRTAPRRLLADRLSRLFIAGGGIAIVASILGILAFIAIEVWPLTRPAEVAPGRVAPLPVTDARAVIADEYRTHAVVLSGDGRVHAFPTAGGEAVAAIDLAGAAMPEEEGPTSEGARRVVATAATPTVVAVATARGRVAMLPVAFDVRFEGDQRVVAPRLEGPVVVDVPGAQAAPIRSLTAQLSAEGVALAAAQLADGALVIVRRAVTTNAFTGETRESLLERRLEPPSELSQLLLDAEQRTLYAAGPAGELMTWSLAEGEPGDLRAVSAGPSPITALATLIGERALVVGQQDGSLSVWFPVRTAPDSAETELVRIREFPRHAAPVSRIAPSARNKAFLALDEAGTLGLYYSTSERTLWRGAAALSSAAAISFAPKGDAVLLVGEGRLAETRIDNPHPEISAKALFGKVWYEGYEGPAYVWQSTGGTDDFESKLSLTPLLVGTLKGTIYSLLLAIPLGVFGAMYASQFMHPRLVRYVKPTVEIMAALPSVVLGFLAGLWLAPRLEGAFPALLLAVSLLPPLVVATGWAWQRVPAGVRGRLWSGTEVLLFMAVLVLGLWLCVALSRPVEGAVFGGSFQRWLLATLGLPYDQRNAVVIGLAMGFAVIPIIFAISEDAFSNVPRNLVAGSLALGANRWQTVTRVVLPSASPGIFSAIMVGFGRAVGETMIVLMATGNTPIMDWNPFNGFRSLSANIAVEIPEAPHGGTLYRVLFLAALLLFLVTFLVNTAAELVRQRLRRRYSEL
jgi:phosphate transport system permease protein